MSGEANPWPFVIGLVSSTLSFLILMRFGLVAVTLCIFTVRIFLTFPITLDASAWYAGYGYAALAILAAIVLYAFRYSLGGRPMLSVSHLDD
jgi:hypothetical protein